MLDYELTVNEWIKNGNFKDAIDYYIEKIVSFPNEPHNYFILASLYEKTGNWQKAVDTYEFSTQLDENNPYIYNNLGHIYLEQNLLPQAEQNFKKAMELEPCNQYFIYNMAVCCEKKNQRQDAEENFKKAIELEPYNVKFLSSFGSYLGSQKKYQDAFIYHKKAFDLDNNNISSCFNLGVTYSALYQYQNAIDCFNSVLKLDPKHVNAHYNLGVNLLLMGDFEKGWGHYEWRYRFFSYMAAIYHLYWKGQNIENKTIYVHAEQGLGDTIQFIRYIKLLKKKKARVVFCVQGELKELVKSFKGIDEIDFMPPAKIKTDSYHVCLLSLPFIFKTNLKNIPKEIPYLFAEKKESEKWKKTFSTLKGLKIGIVWKPSKNSKTFEERYIPLENFISLSKKESINLITLQKNLSNEERDLLKKHNIIDTSQKIENFTDTAAIIDNLDIVIAIDTSVAHLAAAMGKQVLLMLPVKPDWRWMLEKSDSPWYPSVKIFRQTKNTDWQDVINEVQKTIYKILKK